MKKLKMERKTSNRMSRIFSLVKAVVEEDGRKFIQISPTTDGRIASLYP
jgi:hypothetical protein